MLVDVAVEAVGRRDILPMIDKVPAGGAKAAAKRVERIIALYPSFSDIIQETKYSGQLELQTLITQPRNEWQTYMPQQSPMPSRITVIGSMLTSKQRIMDQYTGYMDALAGAVHSPFAARPLLPALPTNIVARMDAPVMVFRMYFTLERNRLNNTFLATVLALHAFRGEHGSYPSSLQALLPGYLTALPRDPFALHGMLKYKQTATGYLLYSVGPMG